ncbi:FHA domain-containing protein [Cellulomonas telluris]|uniref:FHA domain-containing protein n=1 Tax=Cellulomonas telluris TaxID=2306636 RepID=UPI0014562A99|nr:FHA domain-containing protein [Cellulomonas telluris]
MPLIARPEVVRTPSDGGGPPAATPDGAAAGAGWGAPGGAVASPAAAPGPGPVPDAPVARRRAGGAPHPSAPSVGRRVLAQLTDLGVVALGAGAAAGAAAVVGAPPLAATATTAVLVGLALVVAEGLLGATAGAAALGLRTVAHTTGATPGVGRALVRQLVLALGSVLPVAGPLLVSATGALDAGPDRRGWHDRASGTRVVDAAAPAHARGPAPLPAGRRAAGGARPGPGGVPAAPVRGDAAPDGTRAGAAVPPPAPTPVSLAGAADVRPPLVPADPPVAPWEGAEVAPAPAAPAPAPVSRRDAPTETFLPVAPAAPAPWARPAPAPVAPVGPEGPRAEVGDGTDPGAGIGGGTDPRAVVGGGTDPLAEVVDGTDPRSGPAAPAAPGVVPPPPTPLPVVPDDLVELEHTRVRDLAQLRRRATTLALQFDTGPRVRVVGRGLAGRGPRAEDGADILHVVAVDDPSRSVSRVHLEFGPEPPEHPDGPAGVWVMDRGSTNGSVVVAPGGEAHVLPPGTRAVVRAGWTVRIGQRLVQVEDA